MKHCNNMDCGYHFNNVETIFDTIAQDGCNEFDNLDDCPIYKRLLERSDNSDYAVTPTASPKLPSLDDVKYELYKDETIGYTDIELVYETIKKLGNFA